jgi:hypothetical protein
MALELTQSNIQITGPSALVPLTPEELKTLTFRGLFQARLVVTKNGVKMPIRLEEIDSYLGISATTLRAYCNGRSVPRDSLTEMINFSHRLGITCEELHRVWLNTQNSIHGTQF